MYDTIKRFFLPIILTILVVGLVIFLINLNLKIRGERVKLQSQLENLKFQLEKFQSEREELLQRISQGRTEEYLEKIARQELNLQKEGEKVVAFPVIKEKKEEKEIEEKSFWQNILEIFKIR